MPSSDAARMMRMAISPRLATSRASMSRVRGSHTPPVAGRISVDGPPASGISCTAAGTIPRKSRQYDLVDGCRRTGPGARPDLHAGRGVLRAPPVGRRRSMCRAEPPGGHWLRRWSASGAADPRRRSPVPLFQWLAGGQRSVTVDPDDAADVAELLAWASTMDAVLWSPGRGGPPLVDSARRCGPPPRAPSSRPSPRSGSPVRGPTAPATELTLQALSGGPALRGSRAWPPMTAGGQHGE